MRSVNWCGRLVLPLLEGVIALYLPKKLGYNIDKIRVIRRSGDNGGCEGEKGEFEE